MIKQNKLKLIISSLIIFIPTIVFSILGERLGETEILRPLMVFMPIFMLLVHWFCITITAIDNKKRDQHPKVLGLLFWIIPTISTMVCVIMCAVVLGLEVKLNYVLGPLLGITMIVFGNYLPKCKQNSVMGVKLPWTLTDEENWNKTHRLSGRLFVIGGVLLLASSFFRYIVMMIVLLLVVMLITIIPSIYSYKLYKKKVSEGGYINNEKLQDVRSKNKKYGLFTVILLSALFISLGIICFTGSITYTFDDDSFTVDSSYSAPMTVRYLEIDKIEIRESVTPGSKVMGFNSPTLLLDVFKNSEFGKYTRYTYTRCDTCIVIDINGETLVINGESSEKTREIYESIMEHMIVN